MAPKRRLHANAVAKARAKARAKAKAREDRKRSNLNERRQAIREMNVLAAEHNVSEQRLRMQHRQPPTAEKVHDLVRKLEPMCASSGATGRLRAAVKRWADHGGELLQPIVAEEDDSLHTTADVPMLESHRVLQPGFILKSKAFMLTLNSRSFTEATWPAFESWVKERAKTLGARAWSACLEETDPARAQPGQRKFHLHAYFLWTDGVGLYRRNLEDLKFNDILPRVDKCLARKKATPRVVACHGLWYVYLMIRNALLFDELPPLRALSSTCHMAAKSLGEQEAYSQAVHGYVTRVSHRAHI